MSSSLHVLYRFFNVDGDLLYVGITNNPAGRFRDHHKKQWWESVTHIQLAHYANRQELKAAETEAIRTEDPIFNICESGSSFQREEAQSDLFLDEMFAAVGSTGILDAAEAIKEYRRRKSAK